VRFAIAVGTDENAVFRLSKENSELRNIRFHGPTQSKATRYYQANGAKPYLRPA
jgi:hypothetical protein